MQYITHTVILNTFTHKFGIFSTIKVTNLIREDFKKCWHFIVLFICASLLASLFVIIVMGIITRVVIWITLVLILIFLFYSEYALKREK